MSGMEESLDVWESTAVVLQESGGLLYPLDRGKGTRRLGGRMRKYRKAFKASLVQIPVQAWRCFI